MSFAKALRAGFNAFNTAFQEAMDASNKKSSANEAKERLTFTLRIDRVQTQTVITPDKLEAITRDLEQVFPDIVRKHIDVSVAGTKVALGQNEDGGRSPVIKAEFNLAQVNPQASE